MECMICAHQKGELAQPDESSLQPGDQRNSETASLRFAARPRLGLFHHQRFRQAPRQVYPLPEDP